MAIPLGIQWCKVVGMGQEWTFLRRLAAVARASVAGSILGLASGELGPRAIVFGVVKTPPRVWYWRTGHFSRTRHFYCLPISS